MKEVYYLFRHDLYGENGYEIMHEIRCNVCKNLLEKYKPEFDKGFKLLYVGGYPNYFTYEELKHKFDNAIQISVQKKNFLEKNIPNCIINVLDEIFLEIPHQVEHFKTQSGEEN